MHIITNENAEEFYQAYRDVVAMLMEIASQGGKLSDANVWARFDLLKFVDVTDDGKFQYGNLDLVRTGSALAILCCFYDRWEECRPLLDDGTMPLVDAIRAGRLSSFADIAVTVTEALDREKADTLSPWFDQAVRPIYQKYVQSYFVNLAAPANWWA